MVVHFGRIACHVEAQPFGVTVQMLRLSVRLMFEQEIVHFPELALCSGTLGRLGRGERMRVSLFEREVPEDEAHLLREIAEQNLHGGRRVLAVRAFVVTVLDHGDPERGRFRASGPRAGLRPRGRYEVRS